MSVSGVRPASSIHFYASQKLIVWADRRAFISSPLFSLHRVNKMGCGRITLTLLALTTVVTGLTEKAKSASGDFIIGHQAPKIPEVVE